MNVSENWKLITLWIATCIISVYLSPYSIVTAQSSDEAYCFKYTWLGPSFDNSSKVNGSRCEDFKDQPPICINPLVYTPDGSPPNTTAMWADEATRNRVNCRLTKNEVCAKWTYIYNGGVENSTHLCTKITVDGRTPMRSGCETQFKDGYTIEVCACESNKGPMALVVPCNKAPGLYMLSLIPLVLLLLVCYTMANHSFLFLT